MVMRNDVFDAASNRDLGKMQRLHQAGLIRGHTELRVDQFTPLMSCMRQSLYHERDLSKRPHIIHIIRLLLDKGANPFATIPCQRWGLLHEAAVYGDIDIIRLIILNGFRNLDMVNRYFHPVNFDGGDEKYVNFVNQRDNKGRTPLHTAVFEMSMKAYNERDVGIIDLLVEYGADVNATDKRGETPMFMGVQSYFHDPGRYRNLPLAKALYNQHADINTPNDQGETPLHNGTQTELITQFLVSNGANVHALDTNGQTPIFWAVRCGNLRSFEILVDGGADLHSADLNGVTLLHLAHTSIPIARFLLAQDVVIDAVNHDGETPFFIAAKFRNLESAMLLWKNGADLNIRDQKQRSAYDICQNGFQNPVNQVFRMEHVQRLEALAMACHPRLGKDSLIGSLDPGVIRQFISPYIHK